MSIYVANENLDDVTSICFSNIIVRIYPYQRFYLYFRYLLQMPQVCLSIVEKSFCNAVMFCICEFHLLHLIILYLVK